MKTLISKIKKCIERTAEKHYQQYKVMYDNGMNPWML